MIAAIGFNFLLKGSGSTAKASRDIAPSKYNELLGPNIIWFVKVSFSSGIVINASPRSRRSRLPSAKITSLLLEGLTLISFILLSGIKVYIAPVSTQKSSSKNSSGLEGLETFARTLNIPMAVFHFEIFYGNNVTKIFCKINEAVSCQL